MVVRERLQFVRAEQAGTSGAILPLAFAVRKVQPNTALATAPARKTRRRRVHLVPRDYAGLMHSCNAG